MTTELEKPNPDAPVLYFSISLTRLVIMTILTMGLYQVYWLYKNWWAIREGTKDTKIMPVLRSWFFGILFVYALLVRMRNLFSKTISLDVPKFTFVSTTYVICIISAVILDRIIARSEEPSVIFSLLFIYLVLMTINILCLVYIQKRINQSNQKINTNAKPLDRFLPGEIITLIAALVIFSISFLVGWGSITPRDEAIGGAFAGIHRHTVGYAKACEKNDYILTTYPRVFYETHKNEINQANKDFKTIDKVFSNELVSYLHSKKMLKAYEEDLADLGEAIGAESIKETCQALDEHPGEILEDYYNIDAIFEYQQN